MSMWKIGWRVPAALPAWISSRQAAPSRRNSRADAAGTGSRVPTGTNVRSVSR